MRTRWRLVAIPLLLVAGLVLIVLAAFASRRTPVEAVPTTAVVLQALTADACSAGNPLTVSFQWAGRQTIADDAADCSHDYRTDQPVTIYVASNNPLNIGPTKEWILDPSTHDPLDVVGPNDLPSALAAPGAAAIGAACVLTILHLRRRRPQPLAPD